MKKKSNKVVLECSICGRRNYTTTASNGTKEERIQLRKFCKYCGKSTLHKESK
ncbi:MAG: 50S ribosomal protein L33 [Firmicutes bacterium]|uniref:Large ribosomal subunit protein bL33 n=1 Tax=Candidatus Gallilactobacillus intestinavium TaxID=2840838 RepID=A0A9D9E6W4_9LACO|nr:50S ribosomal protein L33 [Candidatus Gallilactobacillus intestinavium]